jgi:toxin ParE1/3/4
MAAKYRVELTRGAEQDLETLYSYLAEHRSADQASALLDDLLTKIELLEAFPERGNYPKEMEALGIHEFRQTLLPPYRIIYSIISDQVVIMIIADGRRDMTALLEQRLLG